MSDIKIFQILYASILGLMMGSFLSMLIPRLHKEEKGIVFGRSHCSTCGHKLSILNLIPFFSYIFQGGKCSFCKKNIPLFYIAIEIFTVLTFLLITITENNFGAYDFHHEEWLGKFLLFSVLIFIFFYDLLYKEIHDIILIPGIILALIYGYFSDQGLEASLLGGLLGALFFLSQYLISKGKWIGSGDIRIGIFMGLILGIKLTVLALIISYILGSIVGIFLLATKKADKKTSIPLGPFLVIGTMISYFAGLEIIDWYMNLMI